ncbi:MAG: TerB family tellurite resistance protein [Myxococcales bacterium]|nr:TerB family tellurite resistance protein [Myxococcales bacterium]MCB9705283.1 TerB family tellurite resistance protein [Myxococcales bacterium]
MSSVPQDKSALHILAFLYLVFSHTTDANLGAEEIGTISGILKKWVPGANDAQIGRVLAETAAWYNAIADDAGRYAEARRCATIMQEQMSETQRAAVLLNLIEIARADGQITAAEDRFIAEITEILNLGDTRAT